MEYNLGNFWGNHFSILYWLVLCTWSDPKSVVMLHFLQDYLARSAYLSIEINCLTFFFSMRNHVGNQRLFWKEKQLIFSSLKFPDHDISELQLKVVESKTRRLPTVSRPAQFFPKIYFKSTNHFQLICNSLVHDSALKVELILWIMFD